MPFLTPLPKQSLMQRAEVAQALSPTAQRVFADAAKAVLASRPTGTLVDAVKAYVYEHMPYLDAGSDDLAISVIMQIASESADDLPDISSTEQEKLQEQMQQQSALRDQLSNLLKHAEDTNAAIAANVKD